VTRIVRSACVPYTPQQMFELVDDVEAYPQFLPWCAEASVHRRDAGRVTATLVLAKGRLRHALTTENRMQAGHSIRMELVEGPFRQLHGLWRFEPFGEQGCRVSLEMEFEFSSRVLALTLGPVFSQIANSLVEAFRRRAVHRYGAR